MGNVLKADGAADNAYVEFELPTDQDEVFLAFDLLLPAAAVAYFAANPSGLIADLLDVSPSPAWAVYVDGADWKEGAGSGQTGGAPAPSADAWVSCLLHYDAVSFLAEFKIGAATVFSDPAWAGVQIHSLRLGLDYTLTNDAAAVVYIRNVTVGTTLGGDDLFSDDFASGDLSAWTTTYGSVSVVEDPGTSVPDPPTLDTATLDDGTVTLDWTAPVSDGGSAITNYKVYRGTASGAETLLVTLGAVLTYDDGTVVNGSVYFYKVTAVNAIGEGAASNELTMIPSPVLIVSVAAGLDPTSFTESRRFAVGARRGTFDAFMDSVAFQSQAVMVKLTQLGPSAVTEVRGVEVDVRQLPSGLEGEDS